MSTTNTNYYSETIQAMKSGGAIMLLQAMPHNALSRISVVCCHSNLSTLAATREIFLGKVDKKPPSLRHFGVALGAHVGTELWRLWFKASGLAVLKPKLERHFKAQSDRHAALKTTLIFSGALSSGQILINPAVTFRTMMQTNKWRSWRIETQASQKGRNVWRLVWAMTRHLYAGAGISGARQFAIWSLYSSSEGKANQYMPRITTIDPHTFTGICLKSPFQALVLSSVVYWPERLTNELQYRPWIKEKAKEQKQSATFKAVQHIHQTQGWWGFLRGFAPASLRMYILVVGSNVLLEQGRNAQREKLSGMELQPSRR